VYLVDELSRAQKARREAVPLMDCDDVRMIQRPKVLLSERCNRCWCEAELEEES